MGDWYQALRTWQDTVNRELNSLGMHAKLVTYRPHWNAPRSKLYEERTRGKNHKYEMSFLVVSLTQEESEVLKEESWNHGVVCTCLLGCQGRCVRGLRSVCVCVCVCVCVRDVVSCCIAHTTGE